MPRFVILEHDYPSLHWDLMLEDGEHLRTWRLSEAPNISNEIVAQESFPHRKKYLDYEGPVSGDRGTVSRWDRGQFELDVQNVDLGGINSPIRLNGDRGTYLLSWNEPLWMFTELEG